MPDFIDVGNRRVDANDGEIGSLDRQIGNRSHGQMVFLSGATKLIPVSLGETDWRAYEDLTVSTSVLPITESIRDNDRADITCEAEAVRFRVDGGDPSSSVGYSLEVGDLLILTGKTEVERFRVIRRDGSDSTLRVTVGMRV